MFLGGRFNNFNVNRYSYGFLKEDGWAGAGCRRIYLICG